MALFFELAKRIAASGQKLERSGESTLPTTLCKADNALCNVTRDLKILRRAGGQLVLLQY